MSKIAPTVAQSDEFALFLVPWQERARVIGRTIGRQQEAEALVAEIEAKIEAARAAHPEFEGATAIVPALFDGPGGQYYGFGPTDVTGPQLLESLGFAFPARR